MENCRKFNRERRYNFFLINRFIQLNQGESMNQTKLRRNYEKRHGKIKKGYHLHHIVPIFEDGTNEDDNLIILSPIEHFNAHYDRWKEKGNIKDLQSCNILKRNYLDLTEEERRKIAAEGGRKGAQTQIKNKIGIHGQTKEERLIFASMGGKKGAFTQSKWQSKFGKRGGPKNKGFIWINDGNKTFKYTKKMQKEKTLEKYLEENTHIRKGRKIENT